MLPNGSTNRFLQLPRLACGFCLGLISVAALPTLKAPAVSIVTGRMMLETDSTHAGSALKAAVVAEVAPGYHINDHVPSLDYLIPTVVTLDAAKPFSVGGVVYPKGVPQKFAFLDTPISVYQGKLLIGLLLKVDGSAAPGDYTLKGALRYQACNENACLPPTSLPLTLAVKVVRRTENLRRVNSDVFAGIKFN